MRFITSAQTSLGTGTDLTVGVIYLGGLRMTLPFVQVDQAAGRNFGIQAAYFFAIRNRSGSPDLRSHFLRLGATYKVTKGRLTFDDRLLYETVINESGADTHRIRNLTRLSYNLAPASHIQPRLFGYAEPIWDRRLGGISRVDVAAGFGATFRGIWRMDVYALRQEILAPSQSTVKAIVVQTTIRLGRRPGRK